MVSSSCPVLQAICQIGLFVAVAAVALWESSTYEQIISRSKPTKSLCDIC